MGNSNSKRDAKTSWLLQWHALQTRTGKALRFSSDTKTDYFTINFALMVNECPGNVQMIQYSPGSFGA